MYMSYSLLVSLMPKFPLPVCFSFLVLARQMAEDLVPTLVVNLLGIKCVCFVAPSCDSHVSEFSFGKLLDSSDHTPMHHKACCCIYCDSMMCVRTCWQ